LVQSPIGWQNANGALYRRLQVIPIKLRGTGSKTGVRKARLGKVKRRFESSYRLN